MNVGTISSTHSTITETKLPFSSNVNQNIEVEIKTSQQNQVQEKAPFHFLEMYQKRLIQDLDRLRLCDEEMGFKLAKCVFSSSRKADFEYPSPEAIFKAACNDPCLLASFLESGVSPDVYLIENGYCHPILSRAIQANCCLESLKLLIQYSKDRNAFVNSKGDGEGSLSIAFSRGRVDIIPYLLTYGVDISSQFSHGCEEDLFFEAVIEGELKKVKFFHNAGFPLNYPDSNGCTALHYAAAEKHSVIISFLRKQNADEKATNQEGKTYLEYAEEALKERNKQAVEKLKHIIEGQRGIFTFDEIMDDILDINRKVDEEENTLLHLAMKNGLTDPIVSGVIIDLIEHGANPLQKNKDLFTSIDLAVKDLIVKEADGNHNISQSKELLDEIVEIFLSDSTASAQKRSKDALNVVVNALLQKKKCYLIKVWMEDILDIDEKIDEEENTLLHLALGIGLTQPNYMRIIRYLIEKRGANPLQKNKHQKTSIAVADEQLDNKRLSGGFHYLVDEGKAYLKKIIEEHEERYGSKI